MRLAVASVGARFGVKGSDAPAWLQQLGFPIPARPNSFTCWKSHESLGSGRCLRQGYTEFLIELDADITPDLQPDARFPGAWQLVRCDGSFLLEGAQWPGALSQVCSFDFHLLRDDPTLVVMTLLAGIGVTVIRDPVAHSDDFALRLWCDASYSTYLHDCLNTIRGSA